MLKPRFKIYHWVLLCVAIALALDAIIAYQFSPVMRQKILSALHQRFEAGISVQRVRFHPLFLSFSAEGLEVFDPESQKTRVLYSRRIKAQVNPLALLYGKLYLSSLTLQGVEIKVVKDQRGVLNVEKVLRAKGAETSKSFHGWKYKDWFYNLYERFKYDVRRSKMDNQHESARFKIGTLRIQGNRLILTDRQTKPLLFHNIDILVKQLAWDRFGSPSVKTIFIDGVFKTRREGRFQIKFFRKSGQIILSVSLNQLDLEALKPLYKDSSPVYFKRGFVTWQSSARIMPEDLYSRNNLKIDSHEMRPSTSWSPENQVFLRVLNNRPTLLFNFVITGHPDRPSFEGFENAVVKIVQKDFSPEQLSLIRTRVRQEMEKIFHRP